MTFDRRFILAASLGASAAAAAAGAGPRKASGSHSLAERTALVMASGGLAPDSEADQSETLQALIDEAANRGVPLLLPPGRIRVAGLHLRSGTRLIGAHGLSVLEYSGGATFLTARDAREIVIEDIVLDGASLGLDANQARGLLSLVGCSRVSLRALVLRGGLVNGIALDRCGGRVMDCQFDHMAEAALFSLDATGLEVLHNRISHCGNNGIQIWRTAKGEDGTIVSHNRIEEIGARSGGSGENGNGVNVFRAGGVLVSMNRISDCAFSAVRGNAASYIQMIANSAARLGEVALYAEFGFEGAIISSNLIDGAASGIEVTNFNEGGRLAVVQGNLIRTLRRRSGEPVDKRGDGIAVEADSVVSGNVIEDAENAGVTVGWGPYMRSCQIAQNLIRGARYGILITSDPRAGACQITANMIAGSTAGAIRHMDHGTATGPDLARNAPASESLVISGNMVLS